MANSQHRCVFVGNVPYDATEEQLVQICEEVGPVVSFRLVLDRETGKPKGYGFCEYKDEETALSARRNLQGYEINGRQLRVDFAENDKGSERNREQGRGGPGLASIDAQKPLAGPGILGDSSLNQPIGLALAATAASVMAGALGDRHTNSRVVSNQNGFQNQPGLGNDPLTLFLAKMSRNQLYEVMSEMKALCKKNQSLVRRLLLSSSQLPKALFQAQIMLGMVTPQVLQMPNIRQSSSSNVQFPLQDGQQDQQLVVLPAHQSSQIPPVQDKVQVGQLNRMPEVQLSSVPQNILIPQPPTLPLHPGPPMQPRCLLLQQAQAQVPMVLPGQSGVSAVSSVQTQLITGFSVRPQMPLKQQMQLPLLKPLRPAGATTVGNVPLVPHNAAPQHSRLPHSLSCQVGLTNSPLLVGGLEAVSREAGSSVPILNTDFSHDANRGPRGMAPSNLSVPLAEKMSMAGETSEAMTIPSKVAKIEDGTSASHLIVSGSSSTTGVGSMPASGFGTGLISSNRVLPSDGMQHSEQQVAPIAPETQSFLLKQVMSLTPEQLSLLSAEQRQQVIELQKELQQSLMHH